jgi:hypothetical protein
MSLTKESAWTIFKGVSLGRPEAKSAIARLTKGEFEAYECLKEDFELELAKIGVEANNEAAAIWEAHPNTKEVLETITPSRWTADNYWSLVSIFKGSKYEQLHLSALFRFSNNELLLDLAAPQS